MKSPHIKALKIKFYRFLQELTLLLLGENVFMLRYTSYTLHVAFTHPLFIDSPDRDSESEGPGPGAAQRPDQTPLHHQHGEDGRDLEQFTAHWRPNSCSVLHCGNHEGDVWRGGSVIPDVLVWTYLWKALQRKMLLSLHCTDVSLQSLLGLDEKKEEQER